VKLEDIVCDFEYAEKLKELGVDRKGLFCYSEVVKPTGICGFVLALESMKFKLRNTSTIPPNEVVVYTVAELGEMLPTKITHHQHGELFLEFEKLSYENYNDGYTCNYTDVVSGKNRVYTDGEKEANARAKLLIWLIENNHVNVEDLNK
jgi:hypothetical protein